MKKPPKIAAETALGIFLIATNPLHAGGLLSVDGGLPLEVEDAYPAAYLDREAQMVGRYERTADGDDQWLLEGRLEYGFARNWEASLHVPLEFGSGVDDEGFQDVGVEALYNFNTETRYVPALWIAGGLDFPTASESSGVDTEVKLLATQSIGWSTLLHRVHLNLSWLGNAGAKEGERTDRFKAVAGYDIRLGPDRLLLANYVWEEELEEGVTSEIVEIGLRQMVNPLTAVAVGIGAGINDESPDFRATVGVQRSF